jgi:hypothetical protein
MDPDKVKAILEAPAPQNAKALSRFLGQIRWHSRMIRHLADFSTPLHAGFIGNHSHGLRRRIKLLQR